MKVFTIIVRMMDLEETHQYSTKANTLLSGIWSLTLLMILNSLPIV